MHRHQFKLLETTKWRYLMQCRDCAQRYSFEKFLVRSLVLGYVVDRELNARREV